MPRDTDHRAIEGHRHEIRPLTPDEERELVQRYNAMHEALGGFDEYLVELYRAGVSQGHIGRVVGFTQPAVSNRIKRYLAKGPDGWVRAQRPRVPRIENTP